MLWFSTPPHLCTKPDSSPFFASTTGSQYWFSPSPLFSITSAGLTRSFSPSPTLFASAAGSPY
ncbi:hypothetical protein K440DRAFT_630893 [Wilcoxina mikolae CBS 423.85]|nr:hypothetical protein K440DRAFT_630893 [Wilcoxina mikolae CBS 423.85]